MTNLTNQAAEIRRHHEAVAAAARTAMEHALAAGALLTEVKTALSHGTFEAWVAENCNFSARTARRYMQLDAHRGTLPAGAGVRAALEQIKTATVSEMKAAPAWLPALGEAAIHGQFAARSQSFWIIWPVEGGYAHAVAFLLDRQESICTKRPIRHHMIGRQLEAMDMPDPDGAEWKSIPLEVALELNTIAREGIAA
jgi:hypothetical protein